MSCPAAHQASNQPPAQANHAQAAMNFIATVKPSRRAYSYNDAGQQIRIADLALGKAVDYSYDALDRRIGETLSQNGLVQRSQTNVYNNQGWLADVSADARFDAGGGASLNQQLAVRQKPRVRS